MNKILNTILAIMVLVLGFSACTDDVDYAPVGPVEGEGVYFSPNAQTAYTLDGTSGSITLDVMRTYSEGATDASLSATFTPEEGQGLFNIPASISFADGSTTSSVTISFDNLVQGTNYGLTLTFDEGTPYAQSSISLSFLYPEEISYDNYTWTVISEEAILTESIFHMISMSNIQSIGITVEKANEAEVYRFQSPFNNAYFAGTFGGNVFKDDSNLPYIYIDGVTYSNDSDNPVYYIAPTALGFSFTVEGNSVYIDSEDTTTKSFGSVFGNIEGVSITDYPLGSFDAATQTFDLGAVYFEYLGYGQVPAEGTTTLSLDPSLLEPDYDRDYTWVNVPEAAGLFTSEVLSQNWVQAVEVAEEDPTFYRMPNLYSPAEKMHIYFHLDKGTGVIEILDAQPTGMTTFGNPVYLESIPSQTSYDAEKDMLSLGVRLYITDENGRKTANLMDATETFLWGQPSEFVAADIADYVGNWLVTFESSEDGGQSPVTITQADATTLKVQGLSLMNPATYDDAMYLDYDAASGQIAFSAQQVAPIESYMAFVAPYNSVSGNVYLGPEEYLIGGLTRNGVLKFVDAPTNQGTFDAMVYLFTPDGNQLGYMTNYWNYLEWEPYTETASTKSMKFEAPKTFKPTLKQGFTPRRTYKTELNIKPQPAQKRNASSLRTKMNVSLPAAGNNFSLVR